MGRLVDLLLQTEIPLTKYPGRSREMSGRKSLEELNAEIERVLAARTSPLDMDMHAISFAAVPWPQVITAG
jgi:hypothetical protein